MAIQKTSKGKGLYLRLCLFWVKITSGNAFPKMRLFGWSGKFYFPEIEIRWPKKKAFDHGNAFTLLFSLQSISGKWERERERARAWEEKIQSVRRSPANSELQSAPISRAPVWLSRRRRELQLQSEIASSSSSPRSRSRSRRRSWSEIAIDSAISRRRDRDRAVDRDPPSIAMIFFFPGLWLVFSGFVFSFFFSKYQKIFSGKFFEMQPNTWKYFPFSGN